MSCPLCEEDGGLLLHRDPRWRLIRATDTPAHPAFYRLIWNAHVAEMSELPAADRHALSDLLCRIEQLLRARLQPAKINLASLGNVVPHLHWHVIARFPDDAQWPAPVWAPAQRETPAAVMAARRAAVEALDEALRQALAGA